MRQQWVTYKPMLISIARTLRKNMILSEILFYLVLRVDFYLRDSLALPHIIEEREFRMTFFLYELKMCVEQFLVRRKICISINFSIDQS